MYLYFIQGLYIKYSYFIKSKNIKLKYIKLIEQYEDEIFQSSFEFDPFI